MKALVLGGTGFIGRRLVDNLLKENCDVTIATSGNSPNPFADAVTSIEFDRFDIASIADKLSSPPYFDVLFDQICFGPDDAANIVETFTGRIGHYVFVSSAAVYYPGKSSCVEEDFDPGHFNLQSGGIGNLGYSEGKRNAEAYMFQHATFPVASARFPIVMGHDDSTMRFQNHVKSIVSGTEIVIPPYGRRRSYVWVEDAGRFLAWLGLNGKSGTYNAASRYTLDAVELMKRMGGALKKEPNIVGSDNTEGRSSYYATADSVLSVEKAENEGFTFSKLEEWLEEEVKKTANNGGNALNNMDYFRKKLSEK